MLQLILLCVVVLPGSVCALNITSNTDYMQKDDFRNILRHYDVQIEKLHNITANLENHVVVLQEKNDDLKKEKDKEIKSLKDAFDSQNTTIWSLGEVIVSQNTTILSLTGQLAAIIDKEVRQNISVLRNDVSGLIGSVASNKQSLASVRDDLIYMNKEKVGLQNKTDVLGSAVASIQTTMNHLKSKDKAIGFTAVNSIGMSNIADNQNLVFDMVITKYGPAYDPSSGIFTAEHTGFYIFFADIRTDFLPAVCWIDIVKNGNALGTIFLRTSTSARISDSSLVVVNLVTGDKVWVRKKRYTHHADNSCTVDSYNTFSGFLLFSI